MPSIEHELLLSLVDDDPALLVALVRERAGLDLTGASCMRVSETFATLEPPTYAADRVFRFSRGNRVVLSVIVEANRSLPKAKGVISFHYVLHEMVRTRAPVQLLVLTDDARVARLAERPVPVGLLGHTLAPIVIGPGSIAPVRDPVAALENPSRALLAALLARTVLDGDEAEAAFQAARHASEITQSTFYLDALLEKHPSSIRAILETLMPVPADYQIKNAYLRDWLARLEARGEQRGIEIGEQRGIEIGEHRIRILALHDMCALLSISIDDARQASLERMSIRELEALRMHLVESRRWPEE